MNTTYFLNQIMGNVFKSKTTPALPSEYYLGVSTTAPSVDGTGVTEPTGSGSGYKRILITGLSAPTNGAIQNTGALSLDESMTDWGTVTHYVVYDSPTGGNLLFYGPLSKQRVIEANTIITFRAGELDITLENVT